MSTSAADCTLITVFINMKMQKTESSSLRSQRHRQEFALGEGGQAGTLETEVAQQGPGTEPWHESGGKPAEASDKCASQLRK